MLFFNTFVCHLVNLEYKRYIFCSFHLCSPFSLWDMLLLLTPVLLFMSSPTGTHYINLTTSCLPCMSDIIAHTDISTRTSQSNVKANKLDVNDTQYDGTCKGSSSEDLQKDVESSSPHKVLALTWPVIWVQHAYNVLECIYSVAMPCA